MSPRTLVFDIETSPDVSYHWSRYDTNISLDHTLRRGGVICWAASWMQSARVEFRSDWDDGHDVMIARMHELLSEADIVVHFNGRSFDEKHLNREFDLAKLGPPAPFQRVDLWQVGRSRFRYTSTKLDNYLLEKGLQRKVENAGFVLWRNVLDFFGDLPDDVVRKARRDMRRYNIGDVQSTKELYVDWRGSGWIFNHPNVGLYTDDDEPMCHACGSTELQKRGFARTQVSKFQRHVCKDCGTWGQSSKRVQSVSVKGVAA